jgi:hypothetical protein
VLTADSAQTLGVKWAAAPGGGGVAGDTIWDTKGDLAAATGADTAAKLPAGSNNKVLTADSTQTTGLKWQLTKDVEVKALDDATVVTTGDGKLSSAIPASLGGCDLTAAHAFVTTVSSSGCRPSRSATSPRPPTCSPPRSRSTRPSSRPTPPRPHP